MINAAVASVLVYKGVKPTYNNLPKTGNKVGDTWNVIAGYGDTPPGTNWAWSGLAWDPLGGTIGTRAFFQTLVINGTTISVADGTLRFAAGTAKGTISINGVNVPINGLASAAYLAANKLVGRITAQAQTPFINIQSAAAPQLTHPTVRCNTTSSRACYGPRLRPVLRATALPRPPMYVLLSTSRTRGQSSMSIIR